jgi:heptosyltransferase-2
VIAIFSSTIPEFGFGPYGENNVTLQKQLYCRPCGIHGKRKCPEKHFRCMKQITVEEVMEAIWSKLATEI